MNFKKGDKVNWCGVEGVIDNWVDGAYPICIVVKGLSRTFTLDGRYYTYHTEPSLKLIECGEGNCEFKIELGSDNLKCCRCGKEKPEKKTVRYYARFSQKGLIFCDDNRFGKVLSPEFPDSFDPKIDPETNRIYIEVSE